MNTHFDLNRKPFFVCIGTSKNRVDMVAPCLGSILKSEGFDVIGTEEDNLHALNIRKRIKEIQDIDTTVYQVIAVDSTIGSNRIAILGRPTKPGKSMGKDLPEIGEISICLNINNNLPREEQREKMLSDDPLCEMESRILARLMAEKVKKLYRNTTMP